MYLILIVLQVSAKLREGTGIKEGEREGEEDGGPLRGKGVEREGRKGREGMEIKEGEGEDVEQQGGGKGREGRGGKRRE